MVELQAHFKPLRSGFGSMGAACPPTNAEVALIVKRLHETFVTLAAQIYNVHEQVFKTLNQIEISVVLTLFPYCSCRIDNSTEYVTI